MVNGWLSKGKEEEKKKKKKAVPCSICPFLQCKFSPPIDFKPSVSQNCVTICRHGEKSTQLALKIQSKWIPTSHCQPLKMEYFLIQKTCHSSFRCLNAQCSDLDWQSYPLNRSPAEQLNSSPTFCRFTCPQRCGTF